MPRFTGKLTAIRIQGDFTKTLNTYLETQVRMAARAWLRAVITRVPVWSGMARGSLKFASGTNGFLARFLNVAVPIDPVPGGTRKGKDATAGGAHGTYQFVSNQPIYTFEVQSDVLHYIHHDFFSRPAHVKQQIVAPWYSFRIGRQAFKDYLKAELKNIPKIHQYYLRTSVPIGR